MKYTAKDLHPYQIQAAKDKAAATLQNKPWWLQWFTDDNTWVTIFGHVNIPPHVSSFTPRSKAIMAHEGFHLIQQEQMGQFKWLIKYLLSKTFRLHQEAQAIAVEIGEWDTLDGQRQRLSDYADALSGDYYHHAAKDFRHAMSVLNSYLQLS